MKLTNTCLTFALAVTCAAATLSADRIILKNGSELKADVLKSDEQSLVVDLGFTVLRLERAVVLEVLKSEEPNSLPPGKPKEKTPSPWQLYHSADLPPSTIEKNSERVGEAVVMVTSPAGQGSGFIITEDGCLITNYHVIARETRIKVTVFHRTDSGFEQKHYKKVKIIALNPFVDLALLKIEEPGKTFKFVYLGSMDELEAGQPVFAIGNPLGLTRTVSQGIISAKNRNFEGQLYIQTTADINPGNSGGPLFNLKGEVIGVTSMGYLFLGGLNFAVPIDVTKRFIENRDAFAYDEDNPNAGFRYLQPSPRKNHAAPAPSQLPPTELTK